MEFSLEEDVVTELEEFVLLARLGLGEKAREFILKVLWKHVHLFPVFAECAAFFIERQNYERLKDLVVTFRQSRDQLNPAENEDEKRFLDFVQLYFSDKLRLAEDLGNILEHDSSLWNSVAVEDTSSLQIQIAELVLTALSTTHVDPSLYCVRATQFFRDLLARRLFLEASRAYELLCPEERKDLSHGKEVIEACYEDFYNDADGRTLLQSMSEDFDVSIDRLLALVVVSHACLKRLVEDMQINDLEYLVEEVPCIKTSLEVLTVGLPKLFEVLRFSEPPRGLFGSHQILKGMLNSLRIERAFIDLRQEQVVQGTTVRAKRYKLRSTLEMLPKESKKFSTLSPHKSGAFIGPNRTIASATSNFASTYPYNMNLGSSWQPSVIIGIDFGTTGTAVAYSHGPHWNSLEMITRWPSLFADSGKVVTQVSYDGEGSVVQWGFACNDDPHPFMIKKEFKCYMNPLETTNDRGIPTPKEARRWYKDYMTSLWTYLSTCMEEIFPLWTLMNVEFVFSVPTHWGDILPSTWLDEILSESGFADESNWRWRVCSTWFDDQRRTISSTRLDEVPSDFGFVNQHNWRRRVYMSKAEAAAHYVVASDAYLPGDRFIACDVGAASTEVGMYHIMPGNLDHPTFKQLDIVDSFLAGSSLIDKQVRDAVKKRLEASCADVNARWINRFAEYTLAKCNFEAKKRKYDGSVEEFAIDVPWELVGLAGENPLVLTSELMVAFDEQIDKIIDAIDLKLQNFSTSYPQMPMRDIMFSGGLSSSPYLQKKLRRRYQDIQLLFVQEPDLVVVKGLVTARAPKPTVVPIQSNFLSPTGSRQKLYPVSYGLLVRNLYDSTMHRSERVILSPDKSQKWAEYEIRWLLKKGENVPETEHCRSLGLPPLKLVEGDTLEGVECCLVVSDLPASQLPPSFGPDSMWHVCYLKGNLSDAYIAHIWRSLPEDSERSSRHRFSSIFRKRQVLIQPNIIITAGQRGVEFAIQAEANHTLNVDRLASVKFRWQEPTVPLRKEGGSNTWQKSDLVVDTGLTKSLPDSVNSSGFSSVDSAFNRRLTRWK